MKELDSWFHWYIRAGSNWRELSWEYQLTVDLSFHWNFSTSIQNDPDISTIHLYNSKEYWYIVARNILWTMNPFSKEFCFNRYVFYQETAKEFNYANCYCPLINYCYSTKRWIRCHIQSRKSVIHTIYINLSASCYLKITYLSLIINKLLFEMFRQHFLITIITFNYWNSNYLNTIFAYNFKMDRIGSDTNSLFWT